MRSIRDVGLEVALSKTEAMFIYNKKIGPPPPGFGFLMESIRLEIGPRLRYLGLQLDNLWNFESHLVGVAASAGIRATSLCRILLNLGGPDRRVRRLYANTVRAVALYGAPVWAGSLAANKRSQAAMNRTFRTVALRTARAYRTVLHAAATVLAGLPPMTLIANEQTEMYRMVKNIRQNGVCVTPTMRNRLRLHLREGTIRKWKQELAVPGIMGNRVVEAIAPLLEEWIGRVHGDLSYRVTQVMTGMVVLAITWPV